ncbi:hypothetical protein DLJ47_31405 [Micromonospora sp. S4605]|nr:hypothetical protein DLJ47_31405 [Micromonospora sp. S4605]
MSGASDESHINGAGAAKTVAPLSSRAARPPPAAALTVTPLVARPNRSVASLGSAAAERDFTTSTSEKPSGCAVTRKSTSGSTFG